MLIGSQKLIALYEERIAYLLQENARLRAEQQVRDAVLRAERDRFLELFVEAMGKKWNEPGPIQSIPLQTRTLEPQTKEDFEQMAARWSAAENDLYKCWVRDVGEGESEPERLWLAMYGGKSPLEALT